MRGAVTLAAAQSLPADTPQRSLLVLIAFVVAAGTLMVQGSTLGWLVRLLGLTGATPTPTSPRPGSCGRSCWRRSATGSPATSSPR